MNRNDVIKVNNVGYDKMYFGSKNKIHGDIKLKNNELFVTPFITLASIFAARPHGDFKIPMGSYNIGYDEWGMSLAALKQKQEPLKEVHISIQGKGYDAIHPYTMESDGYIYEINISDLKDHIYQHPWMNKEREFLIRDVPSVKVAKCHEISVTCHIYGSKSKNPSDGISNRVPVGFIAQNKFINKDSECVTEKTVNKYIDKCKELKRGLSDIHPNENTRGQIWVENGKVVALIVCTKSPLTPPKLINLEVAPKYKNDLNDLLDYAKYVYGIHNFQINESASINYTMRPATELDSDNMYEWEMDSIDESLKKNPKIQQVIRDDVKDSIKNTQMIMDGNKTIGMFTSSTIDGDIHYIGELFIVPEYRGRGIGSSILKSETDKYDHIQLQVSYDNDKAIKLYKSLGFKIIKSDDTSKMHLMEFNKDPLTESANGNKSLYSVIMDYSKCHRIKRPRGLSEDKVITTYEGFSKFIKDLPDELEFYEYNDSNQIPDLISLDNLMPIQIAITAYAVRIKDSTTRLAKKCKRFIKIKHPKNDDMYDYGILIPEYQDIVDKKKSSFVSDNYDDTEFTKIIDLKCDHDKINSLSDKILLRFYDEYCKPIMTDDSSVMNGISLQSNYYNQFFFGLAITEDLKTEFEKFNTVANVDKFDDMNVLDVLKAHHIESEDPGFKESAIKQIKEYEKAEIYSPGNPNHPYSPNSINESYIIESTLSTHDTENQCRRMSNILSDFKYGALIDTEFKEDFTDSELQKYYRLMSPREFEKYHGGICWDYVEWEYDFLKKNGLSPERYFILLDTPPAFDTHTFVVCKTKDNKYVYPEKAFHTLSEKINGCKTFDSLEEIFRLVAKTMASDKGKSNVVFNVTNYPKPPANATCFEFFRFCKSQKIIYKGRTPSKQESKFDEKIYPLFVILSEGDTPIVSSTVKKKTHSPISHACISDDPELKVMYSFGEDDSGEFGFSHESFKRYYPRKIYVYALFLTQEQKTQFDKSIDDFEKHKKVSKFDTNVFLLGFFNKTRHEPSKKRYVQVCSTFVNLVLKEMGIELTSSDNYMVTPKDLSDGVNIAKDFNKIYQVYEGKGYAYDPNDTRKQLLELVKSGYNLIEKGIPEQYNVGKIKSK